jgi:hypothetical protein
MVMAEYLDSNTIILFQKRNQSEVKSFMGMNKQSSNLLFLNPSGYNFILLFIPEMKSSRVVILGSGSLIITVPD